MSTIIKQRTPQNPIKGYEKLGFSVHPDAVSTFIIPFVNGKYDLKLTPEQIEYHENRLGVKFNTPDGQEFLDNFSFEVTHNDFVLGASPRDEFIAHLIQAHKGFGLIKTGEISGPVDNTIFEIFDESKNLENRVNKKQAINEAIALLQDLWTNKRSLTVLYANYLLEVSSGVVNEITAYDRLSEYVTTQDNAIRFVRALKEDIEHIDLVVTIKQAIDYAVIRSVNGKYENAVTRTVYGRNIDEILTFFSNPANQDELGTGTNGDESYTVKAQIKNSNRRY
jgi:hypothetical protein